MVTIKTLVVGYFCLISRVAESPSISGIRTSISIKSGRKREQSAIASRPLAASPITSMWGSSASMSRRPSRARSWSSTMASRVVGLDPLLEAISAPILTFLYKGDDRDHNAHSGADARSALDLEFAAERADPLPHPSQTNPFTGSAFSGCRGRIKPSPEILDFKTDLMPPAFKFDAYPPAL